MGEAGHSGDCSSLFQDSWGLSGSGSSNWTWPRWLTQGHTAGVSVLAVGWAPRFLSMSRLLRLECPQWLLHSYVRCLVCEGWNIWVWLDIPHHMVVSE